MEKSLKVTPQKLIYVLAAVLVITIAALIWIWVKFGDRAECYECTNHAMDTYIQQTVYGRNREAAAAAAAKSIGTLENLISWRIDDSDIAKLNDAAGTDWTTIDKKTLTILQDSLDVAQKSNGAFDPTIFPIASLWDFGGNNQRVPAKEEITKFLPYINYANLRINTEKSSASLNLHYMAIDLSAISRGAACDEAVASYKSAGADCGIISVGNSVGVYGTKRDHTAWQIAIRDPKNTNEKAAAIGSLDLPSGFVSTEGSYEKQFVKNGVTYHHILNPKTGYPENNGLVSVTILYSNGAISDALANACFVLGKEKGLALIKEYHAGGIFIDNKNQVSVTDNLKSSFHLTSGSYKLVGTTS